MPTFDSQRLYPTNVPLYSATEAEYRGYCTYHGGVGEKQERMRGRREVVKPMCD